MLVHNSDKIYVGATKVKKVYAGNTLVYEEQDTPTPPYTALTYIGKGLGDDASNNKPCE